MKVKLADELTTVPFSVQVEKLKPLFADAVTVRELPAAKVPLPLTLPPVLGDALTMIVWFTVFCVKLATKLRLEFTVKVKLGDELT